MDCKKNTSLVGVIFAEKIDGNNLHWKWNPKKEYAECYNFVLFHTLLLLWLLYCQNLHDYLKWCWKGTKRNIIYFDWREFKFTIVVRDILLRFIEFMSMDCDSLTSLLLSTPFISWSEVWIRVEDVSSVISVGMFSSVDRWQAYFVKRLLR